MTSVTSRFTLIFPSQKCPPFYHQVVKRPVFHCGVHPGCMDAFRSTIMEKGKRGPGKEVSSLQNGNFPRPLLCKRKSHQIIYCTSFKAHCRHEAIGNHNHSTIRLSLSFSPSVSHYPLWLSSASVVYWLVLPGGTEMGLLEMFNLFN